MIQQLLPEIIGLIGANLSERDRNSCYLAAKCFHPISYNVEEYELFINNHNVNNILQEDFVAVATVVKKRMPHLKCFNILVRDLLDFDVRNIVSQFRTVFPNIQIKGDISNCINYDVIISHFPDNSLMRLYVSNYRDKVITSSLMLGKQFWFMKVNKEYNSVLQCKELLDSVQKLVIPWEFPIDLSQLDPVKTSVTLQYNGSNTSTNLDLYKISKLYIKYWTSCSFIELFLAFTRDHCDFKKHSHLKTVTLHAHDNFSTENLASFLSILPEQCRVRVTNLYQSSSIALLDILAQHNVIADLHINIYAEIRIASAINIITGRGHKFVFADDFVPPAKCSYNSLREIWDDMHHHERCAWGLIKYLCD